MFLGFSILQYFIIDDKIGKNIFSRMAFPKKKYKKANFPRWMKEIFSVKKKKKTAKVRIEIFQENKRERNLKAINCQKLLYAN